MKSSTKAPPKLERRPVRLDYSEAGRTPKLLPNLSAVATAGPYLWTASDEGRTVEGLEPCRDGYRLREQYQLDALFPGLPGADSGHEADIEALDVALGRLWICGSHSLTRRSQVRTDSGRVDPQIRQRPSRRLFGSVKLIEGGGALGAPGAALPFKDEGSLRTILGATPFIAPFMELPSKENGFDIEGITIFRKKAYIGLRGPVVDNIAIIAAFDIGAQFGIAAGSLLLHFVDLEGLGVRDLTRWGDRILILAGPVSSADGPFRLFRWTPRRTDKIQAPILVASFPSGPDHPEGICELGRGAQNGLLVVYDTTNAKRMTATRYRADWIKLAR